MENAGFSAGPDDRPASDPRPPPADAQPTPPPPPPDRRDAPAAEMKPHRAAEERIPLCHCDTECRCAELAAAGPAAPQVRLKQWSRHKSAVLAAALALLLVWCAVMAIMSHYGVL